MVRGLDIFKKHFEVYRDCYVLIGGTASSLAMDELGVDFRATKDLDIVLIVEALDAAFVSAFWDFVEAGKYQNRQKSTGKRLFYRFHRPGNHQFPFMLELFSRKPDAMDLDESSNLTPIPTEEAVSSLSAILMDDDYYSFVLNQRRNLDGLSYIGAEALIPLKAKAYLDLSARKDEGEQVDSNDIKKHKRDIFRLFGILDRSQSIDCPQSIREDLGVALSKLERDDIDLAALKIRGRTKEEILGALSEIYGLN